MKTMIQIKKEIGMVQKIGLDKSSPYKK